MSSFFLAPALGDSRGAFSSRGLFGEVNQMFPNRAHDSDGWIGDPSHAARPSDHNPCWSCTGRYDGIVRAIDIDISPDGRPDKDLRKEVLEAAIGDPRVWYVISNSIIYSVTFGWKARRYTGSNPHDKHVHVSLRHFHREFDTSRWLEPDKVRIQVKPVSLKRVRAAFIEASENEPVGFSNGVGRIQRVLNREHGEDLIVDGIVGPSTLRAWRRFERELPGRKRRGQLRIPDERSLPALARGHFRVVA